jgi:excisionase family DNA binding protein
MIMQATRNKTARVYLTTGKVARYCGVSKVTVLRWIAQGTLEAFKLPGGQNRIRLDDFYAFASRHNIPMRNLIDD